MILNGTTSEQRMAEIQHVLTEKGTPILYIRNHGNASYKWRHERTQKVLASCFDDDE